MSLYGNNYIYGGSNTYSAAPSSNAPVSSLSASHLRDNFWVVAVLNNPMRYKKRHQLFNEFIGRMKNYGVNLCVVEIAYGDRNFETDSLDVPIKVQLRSDTVLWHKENMINIGISNLPKDWKYVAWIDTDINFTRPDWVDETIHELQHHSVVQLFEDAIDLGPDHEIMNTAKGFVYCYKNGIPRTNKSVSGESGNDELNGYYYTSSASTSGKNIAGSYWHPGYAWAATREAINTIGGLIDYAIVGAADHHMACSLIGEGAQSLPKSVTHDYRTSVLQWQERALRLHKDISYIKGTIFHYWHGKKANRKYKQRWQILTDNHFKPSYDLHKDWQGVLTFYRGKVALRDDVRAYFKTRNEDSIDL